MKLKFDRNDVAKLLAVLPADKSKITIVKDSGIYLMSFDEKVPSKAASRTVAFARGFNPNADGDIWDKCRKAVGGDDFGEFVGTAAEFRRILADSEGDIVVNVTATSISTSYLPKMSEEAKLARIKALRAWLAKVYAPDAPKPPLWSPKFKRTVKKVEAELAELAPVKITTRPTLSDEACAAVAEGRATPASYPIGTVFGRN